jgi:3-phenylpropionate/trans-cinnamate dioxygenase ferredoxin reductase component
VSTDPNIIVGGGQAAALAAQAMRECGFAGAILLFGDETHLPYERPPLSKQYFLEGADAGFKPVFSQAFYREQRIDLRCATSVEGIDRVAKRVIVATGETYPFGNLLLATGARLRRLQLPGVDKSNVLYLRTLNDSAALARHLAPGFKLLVVGGGFIGLEIAAAARQRGCEVVVIEAASQLLGRVAPELVASYVTDVHRRHGITVKTGVRPIRFEGAGLVTSVELSSGEMLAVDAVAVGIGVHPAVELAEDANILVDNGVVVDECCRTSDPSIFAAGDVANQYNPIVKCRLRQESWQNAQDQGITAGSTMANMPRENRSVPWAWSHQFELNLQVAGVWLPGDDLVIRGNPESGSFTAFSMRGRYLRGAIAINRGRELPIINRMLARGEPLDASALASEEVSLRDIWNSSNDIGST